MTRLAALVDAYDEAESALVQARARRADSKELARLEHAKNVAFAARFKAGA